MPAFLPLSSKVLEDLHFSEVVNALTRRARTEPGARRVKNRQFCGTQEAIETSLAKAAEVELLLNREGTGLPFGGVSDVVPMLEHASKGGVLEPGDMVAAANVLRSLWRLRNFVMDHSDRMPLAAQTALDISDEQDIADRIDRSFDSTGRLVDGASFDLGPLRDRVKSLTRGIQNRLEAYLHDTAFTAHLRENYYSVRNDRYVFPVLAQSRNAVEGIVHNASQSGQTVFVEPAALVSLGNDLAIAQSMVAEEEHRILQELSLRLGSCHRRVSVSVEAASELDESEAIARLAVDLDLNAPKIVAADAPFRLLAMRHPLLALKKGDGVVANDVIFDETTRVLVISGPNAGGKTVTLTGVGLCALMLRFGLPIPAQEGSSLPLFLGVQSAVGDDQDLDRDLSTFSAHLDALKTIEASATSGTLILIDEMAADTDPREGAALALAVLEKYVALGARVLITTHLEALKALGMTQDGFVNARVGFDRSNLSPTYRLAFGAPGGSSAIDVARRMGLSTSVCDRATELLDQKKGPLGQAMEALESSRQNLEAERREVALRTRELEAALAQLKSAQACVHQKSRQIEIEERAKLVEELSKVRLEVKNAIRSLQRAPDQKGASQVNALVEKRLAEESKALAHRRAEAAIPETDRVVAKGDGVKISIGDRVRVPSLGDGKVVQIDGSGTAMVQLGALRMRQKVSELILLKGNAAQATKKVPQRSIPQGAKGAQRLEAVRAGQVPSSTSKLDLRGMRVDEGIREADAFLDRCLCEGKVSARIVHGHGTGQLRAALTDYLATSPYVASFQFADQSEGGTGATNVILRTD